MAVFGLGEGFVVLLAARKGVPVALYEAGALDGGGTWALFRAMTLPLLLPWLLLLTVRDIILGFQWIVRARDGDDRRRPLLLPRCSCPSSSTRRRSTGSGTARAPR